MKVKPVNHARAAEAFIKDTPHLTFHDERLWDLRQKRDQQMHELPEWQELRTLASQIKEHTLANLPEYLEQFEANAKKNGIHVHWAADGAEACRGSAPCAARARRPESGGCAIHSRRSLLPARSGCAR